MALVTVRTPRSASTMGVVNQDQAGANSGNGFRPLTDADFFRPRLIICATSQQKKGKTHFALTAPEPIAYFPFEKAGMEGLGRHFKGKDIQVTDYKWERPTPQNKGSSQVIAAAERVVDKFEADQEYAIRNFRTLVYDTATELWALFRIAEFGKLGEVKPHHYAPVNQRFKAMVDRVIESQASLIMLHRPKDEYAENVRTGGTIRDGYKGAEFDAHVCIWLDRDYASTDTDTRIATGPFFFKVYDCRQNPDVVGMNFVQGGVPGNTFQDLAAMVYPEVEEGVWR